jgi:hypothetical protein
MRKLGIFAAIALLSVSSTLFAQGATKSISQRPMTLVARLSPSDQTVSMVIRGKMIYLIGTLTGVVSTDGYVQALDSAGSVKWSLPLDNGSNEIATAASFDPHGNMWVVGSSQMANISPSPIASPSPSNTAQPSPSPTQTVTSTPTVLNPDGITADPILPIRKDLTVLTLWKVSPAGVLLATYLKEIVAPFLVRGVIFANNSINVVGIIGTATGHAGFLIQSDLAGSIGKPVLIGKSDTELNALAKKSDGSLMLLGSSSETIAKRVGIGKKDGILIVISKVGKTSSVVRSSNAASTRSWQSGTNSLFFGGDAIGSGKQEAVITKFASTLIPSWTMRFASTGPALTADSQTSHFFAFPSNGAVTGVKGWKPGKSSALILNVDSKGALTGAFGALPVATPIAIGFSRELGVVLLGRGPTGVSVFHTLPR